MKPADLTRATDNWRLVELRRSLTNSIFVVLFLVSAVCVFIFWLRFRPIRVDPQRFSLTPQNLAEWQPYSDGWLMMNDQVRAVGWEEGQKLLIGSTRWKDYAVSADVRADGEDIDMGLILRSNDERSGADLFSGYYVGLRRKDQAAVIGRSADVWLEGPRAHLANPVRPAAWYRIYSVVVGCTVAAQVTELQSGNTVSLSAEEPSCRGHGRFGLRAFYPHVTWRNISIAPASKRDLQAIIKNADDIGKFPRPYEQKSWAPRVVLFVGFLVIVTLSAIQFLYSRINLWSRELVFQERERYARGFHDTMAQSFAGIGYQVLGMKTAVAREQLTTKENITAELDRLNSLVRQCHDDASRAVATLGLSVPSSDTNLLVLLSEKAREQAGPSMAVNVSSKGRATALDIAVLTVFLQIGFEAIANALLHADPTSLAITTTYARNFVELAIEDDGKGFTPSLGRLGFGTLNMQKSAKSIGAELNVTSVLGQGTTVRVRSRLNRTSAFKKAYSVLIAQLDKRMAVDRSSR